MSSPTASTATEVAPGSRGTVVIADDSPTLRRIVGSVLRRDGFEVVEATDGLEAVQAVFATQPLAVVLDVQMPRVSGYVVARLLKDDWRTADLPVVLLTSLDAASDRYWGEQAGADSYLTKDFEAPELVAALEAAVGTARRARGGRDRLVPEPEELTGDDVLAMVCDLLDRKLFETLIASEVTQLAASRSGFEQTVAGVLDVLQRVVDYDLGAVLLADAQVAYVAVAHETSAEQYHEFLAAAAETLSSDSGAPVAPEEVDARIADSRGLLVADAEDLPDPSRSAMSTYASMPLRGLGGRLVGVLALSSATANAFGETALSTLKVVAGPAAVVMDGARMAAATPVPPGVPAQPLSAEAARV